MATSFESQLPEFVVTRFHIQEEGSYDMLQVRCPRTGCHDPEFWIRPAWLGIRPISGRENDPPAYPVGRNCPSCGRVSALPEALRFTVAIARKKARRGECDICGGAHYNDEHQEQPMLKPKRVVKRRKRS